MLFSGFSPFHFFFVVRYVGRLFVKESGMVLEILSELKELAGFSADEEIDLFEVSFLLLLRALFYLTLNI